MEDTSQTLDSDVGLDSGDSGDSGDTGEVTPVDGDADGFDETVDCNDDDPEVNPEATELCDGQDNDCDDQVDEDDAADASTWYLDADGDGYGNATATDVACDAPSGYVADSPCLRVSVRDRIHT